MFLDLVLMTDLSDQPRPVPACPGPALAARAAALSAADRLDDPCLVLVDLSGPVVAGRVAVGHPAVGPYRAPDSVDLP